MKKVAVIILNWNGAAMLRRFLPSVLDGSRMEGAEVWVADNGSTDASCTTVEQEFPEVRLLRLGVNYGFAEGYNRAVGAVEAEYVVLLNSDVEVTPQWLEPMVAYMDAHPLVAACQPKLLSYDRRDCFEYAGAAGGFMDKYGYPFCRGRVFDHLERDDGRYDTVVPVLWASGAAMLIRRQAYLEAGGLDGEFFAHMEEIDLCWRLRIRGRMVVCLPFSSVYHVGAATLKPSPRKTYLNFRNNLLMLYKNLPSAELASVMRVRAGLDLLAAVVFLLKGEWANTKAVCRAWRDFRHLRDYLYREVREENRRLAVTDTLPERLPCSLVWQCKVKGKKTYLEILKTVKS